MNMFAEMIAKGVLSREEQIMLKECDIGVTVGVEVREWLKANCTKRWDYKILMTKTPWASLLGTDGSVPYFYFRSKRDATLFKMFWGA